MLGIASDNTPRTSPNTCVTTLLPPASAASTPALSSSPCSCSGSNTADTAPRHVGPKLVPATTTASPAYSPVAPPLGSHRRTVRSAPVVHSSPVAATRCSALTAPVWPSHTMRPVLAPRSHALTEQSSLAVSSVSSVAMQTALTTSRWASCDSNVATKARPCLETTKILPCELPMNTVASRTAIAVARPQLLGTHTRPQLPGTLPFLSHTRSAALETENSASPSTQNALTPWRCPRNVCVASPVARSHARSVLSWLLVSSCTTGRRAARRA